MKKMKFFGRLMALGCMMLSASAVEAGGLMTNTNYHIAFDRMMARGASTEIDAAYSNPAGLAWGHEGWQLSFNVQKPFQWRNVEATVYQPYANAIGLENKLYEGKADANPFVPALFAAYKHKRWAVSLMAGIVGRGGHVTYDEGIPMFEVPVRGMMYQNGLPPAAYSVDAFMTGKQYIYGVQACFTYKFSEHWSAAAGLRVNIYTGYNRGHVISRLSATGGELVNLQIDADQNDVGVAPILGLNYRYKRLLVTARYEFRSKLNTPNDTKVLSVGLMGQTTDVNAMSHIYGNDATVAALAQKVGPEMADKVRPYLDGETTRYDMPGLLTFAVGYEFIPKKFRGTLEYHWFNDKNAKMQGNRQDELTHDTHEILVGLELDINKIFTVSAGAQRTDYGLSDGYQANTSFACDSYSVGGGAAFNVTPHLRINAGYFCSIYSDYTREQPIRYSGIPVMETYSRTNHVIGLGVDYKF